MDGPAYVVQCWAAGCLDALAWPSSFAVIYGSKRIRTNAVKCVVLNGLIFLGSLYFFNNAIKPLLLFILSITGSRPAASTDTASVVVDYILGGTYYVLWVYPIYCLSFLLNSIWYQEIADAAYLLQIGRPVAAGNKNESVLRSISARVADEIFRMGLQLVFVLQMGLIKAIPGIGPPVAFVFMSWLYALYCFEYKWINKGWSLERRLDYFERHWAYLCGFGVPFACGTFFFPHLVDAGAFALLFPSYIIMANSASPRPDSTEDAAGRRTSPERLPIFKQAKWLNTLLLRVIPRLKRSAAAASGPGDTRVEGLVRIAQTSTGSEMARAAHK
eukprot:Opistho-2@50809